MHLDIIAASQGNVKYLKKRQVWYDRCMSGQCKGHQ